ncbi:hypothetical protein JW979_03955, partial [bacterium]|nr:hypothetical protein [candidate division CSSED10-310 bacterium]
MKRHQIKVHITFFHVLLFMSVVFTWNTFAQEPPHIDIEKILDTAGEICPGQEIEIHITLYGNGSAGFIRDPLDAVCVIDKSGSMTWNGQCCYNENAEPPYGPAPDPNCYPPYDHGIQDHPYVDALWAAWKFYQFLVDVPPSIGYQDYGGLVFYGDNNYPNGVPGLFAVRTPTPVQGLNPKLFWWNNHLEEEPVGGWTAMGPGMQVGKSILAAMPTHPAPEITPGVPTPATPYYDVKGDRYMVVLTDGRPNRYWTPAPGTPPPFWGDGISHSREMSRRSALSDTWPEGGYSEHNDITVYTIGLGGAVDGGLMTELAQPFLPRYVNYTPTPLHWKRGEFLYAITEADLIDVFQEIAAAITNDRAGKNIEVREFFGDTTCTDSLAIYTDIIWWNIPPTLEGDPPTYVWNFDELRVDDEIHLAFRLRVDPTAPTNTLTRLECPWPDSKVTYFSYRGDWEDVGIVDPGLIIGPCLTPTPYITATPTETATPTTTPTCIPGQVFFETFESGDFSQWESYGPSGHLRVLADANHAFHGTHCLMMAGADAELYPNEGHVDKYLNFAQPLRPGAFLDYHVKMRNFADPEKADGKVNRDLGDRFIVEVYGSSSVEVKEYSAIDMYYHGANIW